MVRPGTTTEWPKHRLVDQAVGMDTGTAHWPAAALERALLAVVKEAPGARS